MSSIKRLVGDKLFLNLQLHDGEDNMPVQVFVDLFDSSGAKLNPSPIELSHASGGYFSEENELMPNTPFLIAQYSVLEPSGTECPHYTQELDRFDRATPVEIPSTITPKPFAIVAKLNSNQRVVGKVVSSGRICAQFKQSQRFSVVARRGRTKVSIRSNRITVGVRDE